MACEGGAGPRSSAALAVRHGSQEGQCTFHNIITFCGTAVAPGVPPPAGRGSGTNQERAQEAGEGPSVATCRWGSPPTPTGEGIEKTGDHTWAQRRGPMSEGHYEERSSDVPMVVLS